MKPDETGFLFDCCMQCSIFECSIMFDCLRVRLAKFWGEFVEVRLPNPIEVNRTIGIRLGSITEPSIDYAGSGKESQTQKFGIN